LFFPMPNWVAFGLLKKTMFYTVVPIVFTKKQKPVIHHNFVLCFPIYFWFWFPLRAALKKQHATVMMTARLWLLDFLCDSDSFSQTGRNFCMGCCTLWCPLLCVPWFDNNTNDFFCCWIFHAWVFSAGAPRCSIEN